MHLSKKILLYSIIILFVLAAASSLVSAEDEIPFWNSQWSYRQQIILPISTQNPSAHYQPIDISIEFNNPCWTKNVNQTSIRILCWHQEKWHELESQIYNIKTIESDIIDSCNIVFLIPAFADDTEKYFIYYDHNPKPAPTYQNRVTVKDLDYFSSPISGITAEAKFYGIMQGEYCIYGVGQQGTLLDRSFSNLIVKQEKNSKTFDLLNSDQIITFSFAYFDGPEENNEISSDQVFVHKEIFIDGNLMVRFGVISESENKNLRTIAIYTYYYSPTSEKRIYAHVKHFCYEDVVVSGQPNIDGRFGAMFSFKSRNPSIKRMNFGDILPTLRVYGKHEAIEQYQINTNPTSKDREWIISYQDDVDLGSQAWFAQSNDNSGKANGVIFSSNNNIVTSGTDERDGIQLKVAVINYLNVLGSKIDYAAVNFGRNSYEKGQTHDLKIPSDLVVEFHAEIFSTETNGYKAIEKESEYFQQLIKHRTIYSDSLFEEKQRKHNLEVITHLGGTRLTFPWLKTKTNGSLPVLLIELYQDDVLMYSGIAKRSILFRGISSIFFPEVIEGTYLIKVFWMRDNSTRYFRGARVVDVDANKKIHVLCTYERSVKVSFFDTNDKPLEGIYTVLLNQDDIIFDSNNTNKEGEVVLKAPYNARNPYRLQAYYRDILIYDDFVRNILRNVIIDLDIALYDFNVEIKDMFDLPPGVAVNPTVVSYGDRSTFEFIGKEKTPGMFSFTDIPAGFYLLRISHGSFVDELVFEVPVDDGIVTMDFSAQYEITIDLYTTQGILLSYDTLQFRIQRDGKFLSDFQENNFILPPGTYFIEAYADQEFVGSSEIEITYSKKINFVTNVKSIIPLVVFLFSIIFIAIFCILLYTKKIDIGCFIRFIALILIVLALLQPWWGFYGISTSPTVEYTSQLFVSPQVMIEQTTYPDTVKYELAEMPEMYVGVLEKIFIVILFTTLILSASFILEKFEKKKSLFFVDFLCLIVFLVVLSVFITATIRLAEIIIGDVFGSGPMSVSINEQFITMQSSWGFSTGFYLYLVAILLVLFRVFFSIKNFVFVLCKKNA
jgi:hypothetical protein